MTFSVRYLAQDTVYKALNNERALATLITCVGVVESFWRRVIMGTEMKRIWNRGGACDGNRSRKPPVNCHVGTSPAVLTDGAPEEKPLDGGPVESDPGGSSVQRRRASVAPRGSLRPPGAPGEPRTRSQCRCPAGRSLLGGGVEGGGPSVPMGVFPDLGLSF